MRRVAEIIHIVEEQREEFIKRATAPDIETQRVLWLCGVRKQLYFAVGELIVMTFEYGGNDFSGDMKKMAAHLEEKGMLVQKRRREIPVEERDKSNWWAPLKKLGSLLEHSPGFDRENGKSDYIAMLEGSMDVLGRSSDIAYSDEDWTEDFHF